MEKTETTIFVDWQNLLHDLKAIQDDPRIGGRFSPPHFNFNNPEQLLALIRSFLESEETLDQIYFYVSEPFTELESRIKGKDKENLEKFKKDHPEHYKEKVDMSEKIQDFNRKIAQQNQVTLRVGRVKYKFKDMSEVERYFSMDLRTNQESLDLRQKGIDTLLAHDIAKLCYTATLRCVFLSSKDTDFAPVLEEIREQGFKIFIAEIKESHTSIPLDLRKSCDVRERSVDDILAKLPKNQNSHKKKNSSTNEPFNNPFKDLRKKN